jgi:hypothetical protein
LAAGVTLAVLGQYYLSHRRDFAWDGLVFWSVAAVLLGFVAIRSVARGTSMGDGLLGWQAEHRFVRASAAGCGLLISLTAGLLARERAQERGFGALLALWMIGVGSYLLAFVPLPVSPWPAAGERRRRYHSWAIVGLSGLLALAFAVRVWDLEHIPRNFGGDEGIWAMEGLAMLAGGLANPFDTRWFSFPSMSFLAWGVSMRVFGQSVAGVRTLSALLGAGAVVTTFALARELWGPQAAWFSAIALAFGHYHLHFSRLAVNNVADALTVTLALWLLVRGLRRASCACLAWAGAAIGIGWYGYFGGRLVGLIAAAYIAVRAVVERGFLARHGRSLLVIPGAALAVAVPLLLHYAQHPGVLSERAGQVSIFSSGWLAHEQELTGRSAASLLLRQLWRSISAFNYTRDPTFWYGPGIPLLDFVSGSLFAIGLVWATIRVREPPSSLLLIWFWLSIVAGWAITENPPSSQRLVIAAPALAISVALGLGWVIRSARRAFGGSARLWTMVGTGVSVAIAIINLRYYFIVYTPKRVYGNPTAEIATVLARHLTRQTGDSVVYFHGAPEVYWDAGTLRFMAMDVEGVNVPPVGEGEPIEVDPTRGMRFVFLPGRLDELPAVQGTFPGGSESSATSGVDGRLLYTIYEVAPVPK